MRAAAGREWGAEAGDQVVRSRAGGFAKPTGPAGGLSCELSSSGAGGGGGDGGGGGVDTTAVRLSAHSVYCPRSVHEATCTTHARNERKRVARARQRNDSDSGRKVAETLADDRAAMRAYLATLPPKPTPRKKKGSRNGGSSQGTGSVV